MEPSHENTVTFFSPDPKRCNESRPDTCLNAPRNTGVPAAHKRHKANY